MVNATKPQPLSPICVLRAPASRSQNSLEPSKTTRPSPTKYFITLKKMFQMPPAASQ
jgi:hypothetical protein